MTYVRRTTKDAIVTRTAFYYRKLRSVMQRALHLQYYELGGGSNSPTDTSFYFFGCCETVYLVRRPLIGLLYQSSMIDDHDDCEAVGGVRIRKGNRSTRRKPAPVPRCTPSIPCDLSWDQTRTAAVESPLLTAWPVARLIGPLFPILWPAVNSTIIVTVSCRTILAHVPYF
jgi:hypothetical protein